MPCREWTRGKTGRSLGPAEWSKGTSRDRQCPVLLVAAGAEEFPCGVRGGRGWSLRLHGRCHSQPRGGNLKHGESHTLPLARAERHRRRRQSRQDRGATYFQGRTSRRWKICLYLQMSMFESRRREGLAEVFVVPLGTEECVVEPAVAVINPLRNGPTFRDKLIEISVGLFFSVLNGLRDGGADCLARCLVGMPAKQAAASHCRRIPRTAKQLPRRNHETRGTPLAICRRTTTGCSGHTKTPSVSGRGTTVLQGGGVLAIDRLKLRLNHQAQARLLAEA